MWQACYFMFRKKREVKVGGNVLSPIEAMTQRIQYQKDRKKRY